MTAPFQASFDPKNAQGLEDSSTIKGLIQALNFLPHPEGGYYVETDRDSLRIPNPFLSSGNSISNASDQNDDSTRSASTTIHYLLTPSSPLGHFHRNRARTVHTLHKGRGRYVIIHADEVAATEFPDGYERGAETSGVDEAIEGGKARRGGGLVLAGERLQWIVPGGKYKASFLLPDTDSATESEEGLLISETVVPGFEFADHDFLNEERFRTLITESQAEEMKWMVRRK